MSDDNLHEENESENNEPPFNHNDGENNSAPESSAELAPAVSAHFPVEQSIVRGKNSDQDSVPLWLITFTDVMALMLTFFVLLYAMSVPSEDKWEVLSSSLSVQDEKFDAKAFNAGSQDVISIEKVSRKKALDLDYVEGLIKNQLESDEVEKIYVQQNQNRLIISLPSELLFESGQAEISAEGKQLIFSISGILNRIKNRVEVLGHADPRPITGANAQYKTNWELSLARAIAVQSILSNVGYDRPVSMRGAGSARFTELPETLSEEQRLAMSRRVDLVVMNDRGYRNNMVNLP